MIRKIVKINEEKCNGCGACANACHEGAIGMIDGKAMLLRDDYCDGLGDCLPACPTGAISFEEREAAAYDEEAVKAHMAAHHHGHACPGSASKVFMRDYYSDKKAEDIQSRLAQWPCQIKLAPIQAPYFDGAELLIAADCTAFAYGDCHRKFMEGKICLIGCPKLDSCDYSEKLSEIICRNNIRKVNVVRMEVPCCGGIEMAVRKAAGNIPVEVKIISTDGRIIM